MSYTHNPDYNPKNHNWNMRLDDRHYKAIEMRFAKKYSNKEIAEAVGISENTLHNWVMCKKFKEEEEKFRTAVRIRVKRRLVNLTEKALDTLEDGLNGSKKSQINVRCAELVLKYSGLEPDKNINLQADITATQLTLEEKKALLLAKLSESIVESEQDNQEQDCIEDSEQDIEGSDIDADN